MDFEEIVKLANEEKNYPKAEKLFRELLLEKFCLNRTPRNEAGMTLALSYASSVWRGDYFLDACDIIQDFVTYGLMGNTVGEEQLDIPKYPEALR